MTQPTTYSGAEAADAIANVVASVPKSDREVRLLVWATIFVRWLAATYPHASDSQLETASGRW
jgi:hypothetical protein